MFLGVEVGEFVLVELLRGFKAAFDCLLLRVEQAVVGGLCYSVGSGLLLVSGASTCSVPVPCSSRLHSLREQRVSLRTYLVRRIEQHHLVLHSCIGGFGRHILIMNRIRPLIESMAVLRSWQSLVVGVLLRVVKRSSQRFRQRLVLR